MIKSIHAQLILVFVGIILLGSFASALIGLVTIEPNMIQELSGSLNGVLGAARDVYEKEQLTADDIEKLHASGFIAVRFYESDEALLKDYRLSKDDLLAVNSEPIVFKGRSKGKLNLKIPVSVVKSGNRYMVAVIRGNNVFANFRTIILFYNLLSILCGAIVMLILAKFIVKPIKKLIFATEKIAKGDFAVYIEKDREDEIGQLIENFNKMTKELSGMEMMRNNFVSDISHEFKTPLTSIEGYTKLLRDCKNEEQRKEYIDIITEETKRLSALSGNILLINRIENENIAISKNPFRLDEQIRQVILTSEGKWSNKNIDLQIDLDEVTYVGNEALLHQVWLNLFDNAVKFSKSGAVIEIGLRKDEKRIVFSITDYGVGITDEQQKRMFEKFYTGDKSRNTEGNGLGLSIVKRIVDMHDGAIEVKSKPGAFTTIKVKL